MGDVVGMDGGPFVPPQETAGAASELGNLFAMLCYDVENIECFVGIMRRTDGTEVVVNNFMHPDTLMALAASMHAVVLDATMKKEDKFNMNEDGEYE